MLAVNAMPALGSALQPTYVSNEDWVTTGTPARSRRKDYPEDVGELGRIRGTHASTRQAVHFHQVQPPAGRRQRGSR